MSEQLKEILALLIQLVILPAIPIISKYVIDALKNWAHSKAVEMENATIAEYLIDITDTIETAVLCTTQTYVESLKAQGKFDEEAQKIAFKKTKTTVMALLAQDAKDFLAKMYGDADLWIDTKIEQITNMTKQ